MPMLKTAAIAVALLACCLTSGRCAPEKTIFAHFYYWYPINAGIVTHHAPEGHFDRDDVSWWKGEMRNAHYAGIDVLALMYWDVHSYNPAALEVMLQAVREMDAAGEPHPKVCMHLDGIEHVANVLDTRPVTTCDLTDPASQDAVADAFVNFFSFFKEREMLDLCFRHEGKLVAFVYRPEYRAYTSRIDDSAAEVWREGLRDELDEELYLVLETAYATAQWAPTQTDLHCTTADNYFRWDAALAGALMEARGDFPIATIGPGFDPRGQDSTSTRIRHRRQGFTFRNDFRKAISSDAPWLVIETFNFFEEGTDITETQEFGRQYLDIARKYSARFKGRPEIAPH